MAVLVADGKPYDLPEIEPRQDRDLGGLDPRMFGCWLAWLRAAQDTAQHVEFRPTECRRTLARQAWLYAQGRVPPHDRKPEVTWTMQSLHRAGMAIDFVMIHRGSGAAIWTPKSYEWLYRHAPPERFGLQHGGSFGDWVHLELVGAVALIEAGAPLVRVT